MMDMKTPKLPCWVAMWRGCFEGGRNLTLNVVVASGKVGP